MCPPSRNDPPALAAHDVNHYDLDIFHEADGQHAVFAVAALSFLEDWSVEDLRGVLKVNQVLCEIRLTLAFVPLEKHGYSPRG